MKPLTTTLIQKITHGYLSLFYKILFILIVFLVAVVISIIISYPLWIFATNATQEYNIFVCIVVIGGIIGLIIVKVSRAIITSQRTNQQKFLRKKFRRTAKIIYQAILILFFTYALLFIFSRYGVLLGILTTPVILLLLGILLFTE